MAKTFSVDTIERKNYIIKLFDNNKDIIGVVFEHDIEEGVSLMKSFMDGRIPRIQPGTRRHTIATLLFNDNLECNGWTPDGSAIKKSRAGRKSKITNKKSIPESTTTSPNSSKKEKKRKTNFQLGITASVSDIRELLISNKSQITSDSSVTDDQIIRTFQNLKHGSNGGTKPGTLAYNLRIFLEANGLTNQKVNQEAGVSQLQEKVTEIENKDNQSIHHEPAHKEEIKTPTYSYIENCQSDSSFKKILSDKTDKILEKFKDSSIMNSLKKLFS